MKRYLLFCFNNTEWARGWDHFKGSFDTVTEAKAAAPTSGSRQIVDTETERVICQAMPGF
jgi:hypothetical protein